MKRLTEKIGETRRFLEELESITPASFEEYAASLEKRAACERYIEKIVEAVTDIAFLIIRQKKLRMPEDDADAFNILAESKLFNHGLCKKMKEAKGMRNILAHQYGKIDDKLIFDSIANELQKDVGEFADKAAIIV